MLAMNAIIASNKWTPKNQSVLWSDASTLNLADGARVAELPDLTGNGHHRTQENSNKPYYEAEEVNGLGAVRFDRGDGTTLLWETPVELAQPFTYACVLSDTTGNTTEQPWMDGGIKISQAASGPFKLNAGASIEFSISQYFPLSIFIFVVNGANSQIWMNGELKASGNAGSNAAALTRVGPWGGLYCEDFLMPGVPDEALRRKCNTYLSKKWGIVLAT
jgi:hypothetical protein